MADSAKAFLLRSDADGQSVYQHLYELVSKLLREPDSALLNDPKSFAEISRALKERRLHRGDDADARAGFWRSIKQDALDEKVAQRVLDLFDFPAPMVETVIAKPNPFTTVTTTTVKRATFPPVREVSADLRYLAAAGFGISREESCILDLAISRLVVARNLTEVRYFGRIYGKHGFYDILEARHVFPEVTEPPRLAPETYDVVDPPLRSLAVPTPPEPPGRGLNRWSYWVRASDPTNAEDMLTAKPEPGEWIPLPDVTPQQIVAARGCSRAFTGRLDSPVIAYPPFPGCERHLLRAQIARIASGTIVTPQGSVSVAEPEDEDHDEEGADERERLLPLLETAAGFADDVRAAGGISVLSGLQRWVHSRPHVHLNGRSTVCPARPEPEDDVEDALEPPLVAAPIGPDDVRPLLEPIARDTPWKVESIPQPPVVDAEGEDGADGRDDRRDGRDERDRDDDGEPAERASRYGLSTDDGHGGDDEESGAQRRRTPAWTVRVVTPAQAQAGAVVVARSERWPGAVAWCGAGGRDFGSAYFGRGIKRMNCPRFPQLPPPLQVEPSELPLAHDPQAKAEKVVPRGEDMPPDRDEEGAVAPQYEGEEEDVGDDGME